MQIAAPRKRFKTHLKLFNNIVVLWLIPGFNCDLLRVLIESNEEIAIVLSFYGASRGVAAIKLYNLLNVAKTKYKKEIVLMSQCSKGHVDIYSTNEEEEKQSISSDDALDQLNPT
eukprot:170884_1